MFFCSTAFPVQGRQTQARESLKFTGLSSSYSSYLKCTDARRNVDIGFQELLGKNLCPPCQGLGAKRDDLCKQQGKASPLHDPGSAA